MLMEKKPASEIAQHMASVALESMGTKSGMHQLLKLVKTMEGHRDILQGREEYHQS